jgi:hypothetical protein
MKKHIKIFAALVLVSATFTFCSKEEDKKETTTTTTTTTGTPAPTSNFFTADGSTLLLLKGICQNDPSITSTIVSAVSTTFHDSMPELSVIATVFSQNAAQGEYVSVENEADMAAGKCIVSALNRKSGESMRMKAGQKIKFFRDATTDKVTIEIVGRQFLSTSSTFNGERAVTANFGCN